MLDVSKISVCDGYRNGYAVLRSPIKFVWSYCGKDAYSVGCVVSAAHQYSGDLDDMTEYAKWRIDVSEFEFSDGGSMPTAETSQSLQIVDLTADESGDDSERSPPVAGSSLSHQHDSTQARALSSTKTGSRTRYDLPANCDSGEVSAGAGRDSKKACDVLRRLSTSPSTQTTVPKLHEVPGTELKHDHVDDPRSPTTRQQSDSPWNCTCVRCSYPFSGDADGKDISEPADFCEYHSGELEFDADGPQDSDMLEAVTTDEGKSKYADELCWSCCGVESNGAGCCKEELHTTDVQHESEHYRLGLEILREWL